jgi:Ca2+/Na+ antiporter
VCFDRSAKIYTAVLVFITTIFTAFLAFYRPVKDVAGPVLLGAFVVYVGSIAYGIYRGVMSPPEDSDSDSSDSDSDSDSDSESDASTLHDLPPHDGQRQALVKSARNSLDSDIELAPKSERTPAPKSAANNKRPKDLRHHLMKLLLGFLALTVSCYVLSHSIGSVGDALNMSSTVVGITVLSLATTLPEKMVAIVGGARGEGGIVIANTVGSNIFLMTLCAGVLFVSGDKEKLAQGVHFGELAVMWLTSLALCACVFVGANRRVGYLLFGLYIVFLVAEFALMHKRDI